MTRCGREVTEFDSLQLTPIMTTPFAITVIRTRKRRPLKGRETPFREFQRGYSKDESIRWFVIELLLFGLLVLLSAWPMIHAIEALRML